MNTSRPSIGAHVSAAGGLATAITRAQEIGAECIQIFGASPRSWAVGARTPKDIADFKKAREEAKIKQVYLHGAYLVNLASPDAALRQKSEVNLAAHLKIAEAIEAEGLIFHIGSGHEMPKAEAIEIVVESMKRILRFVGGRSCLVIENSAGGGQKIGSTPEEVGEIIRRVHSRRVKACWDTAHAFEAGMIEHYNDAGTKTLVRALDRGFGVSNLAALHINDSKTAFNSKHDRHENLGQGYIGLAGFKALARERSLYAAAWILEVPGFDNLGPDKKNVDILRSCF